MEKQITAAQLADWTKAYQASRERQMAALALSKAELNSVAFSQERANAMHRRFSLEVPTMEVTDQQHSGRCWLFAATNVLRECIGKQLNIEGFELSQSYLAFWDKFERCNYFLEAMLDTANQPEDDRTVSFVLQTGVHDGGQWDMFAAIVEKYGIVPKDAYDETYQSSHTGYMNYTLNRALKTAAARLRKAMRNGMTREEAEKEKDKVLGDIYQFLCSCYGVPPTSFDFEYYDKDKKYHAERGLTPRTFADKYVKELLDSTVSVIHAPTKDKPCHKTYTIRLLGNVVGGRTVKHLNLTMDELKQAVIRQLEAGKVVWFGSDVGHDGERKLGLWDDQSFNLELLTGLDLEISKEDALDYGFAAMNHAMCLTGVNLADGKPTRWKIENSWGDKSGEKGYYICSDSWFDRYVFQAAIEREYLGDLAALYDQEPAVLEPWDPMGTLAD
ncbi:MAG: C1 family peptidase [Clostridia bacterium]|nr:C1 family peptidase [Clostridia bacterium]